MRRGRKRRPELTKTERDRLAREAQSLRSELLKTADTVERQSEDHQLCERQAQSLNTFGNLIRRQR
jgi:hypothetical protein